MSLKHPKPIVFEWVDGRPVNPPAIQKLIEEACKRPVTYTKDAPKLTKKQLSQFKHRSPERLARFGLSLDEPQKIQKTQEIQEPLKKRHCR